LADIFNFKFHVRKCPLAASLHGKPNGCSRGTSNIDTRWGTRGKQLTRSQGIRWSLVAWLAVGIFWLLVTRAFHPTWVLAVIVTSSLVCAYAAASYINHLALVPKYFSAGRYGMYAAAVLATMALLTALALTIIRISYFEALGPDPDPNGLYIHFAIDFTGMLVHVAAAASVVWFAGRFSRDRQTH
jgi:hypothetical protein